MAVLSGTCRDMCSQEPVVTWREKHHPRRPQGVTGNLALTVANQSNPSNPRHGASLAELLFLCTTCLCLPGADAELPAALMGRYLAMPFDMIHRANINTRAISTLRTATSARAMPSTGALYSRGAEVEVEVGIVDSSYLQ